MDSNKKFFVTAFLEILLQVENRLKVKPENTVVSCMIQKKVDQVTKTMKNGMLFES